MFALWHSGNAFIAAAPPPVAAGILLCAGILLLFYGWRIYKIALVVVGMFLGWALGAALGRWLGIPPVIAALPMALLLGIGALLLQKAGAFLAGGFCGLLLIEGTRGLFENEWGFYVAAALAFLVGALLALYMWRPMITVSLALIGASFIASALVIGVDLFKPGWGSSMATEHAGWLTAALIAAAIAGVYVQTRHEAKPEETD